MKFSVREMRREELVLVIDYFVNSDSEFLLGMGADKTLLPEREEWLRKLHAEFDKPVELKEYFYILWLEDGRPVGHSNINFIKFGESAKMHLHLWHNDTRKKGRGEEFIKKSIPLYFEKFKLQNLICEPYANNPAPNKILPKIGFEFIRKYETTPGVINFLQRVNRYVLRKASFIDRNS